MMRMQRVDNNGPDHNNHSLHSGFSRGFPPMLMSEGSSSTSSSAHHSHHNHRGRPRDAQGAHLNPPGDERQRSNNNPRGGGSKNGSSSSRHTKRSPSERRFRCDQMGCERMFFTRKDVKRHMVVHTGVRNFACPFCQQRFGRKDHLVRHAKKSHNRDTRTSATFHLQQNYGTRKSPAPKLVSSQMGSSDLPQVMSSNHHPAVPSVTSMGLGPSGSSTFPNGTQGCMDTSSLLILTSSSTSNSHPVGYGCINPDAVSSHFSAGSILNQNEHHESLMPHHPIPSHIHPQMHPHHPTASSHHHSTLGSKSSSDGGHYFFPPAAPFGMSHSLMTGCFVGSPSRTLYHPASSQSAHLPSHHPSVVNPHAPSSSSVHHSTHPGDHHPPPHLHTTTTHGTHHGTPVTSFLDFNPSLPHFSQAFQPMDPSV